MPSSTVEKTYYILKPLKVPGIGNAEVKRILDNCFHKGISVKDFVEGIAGGDRKTHLLTPSQINSLVDGDSRFENQWKAIEEQDIRISTIGDNNYPARVASALNN